MLRASASAIPQGALTSYPHEFSGGMRQRIMLASVMLLKPALLIADEPTTALDAVIQRDVMELMVELTTAEGTAVLLISHDLPMVARYTNRIVVMEKGVVVEQGTTEEILRGTAASLYAQAAVFPAVPRRVAVHRQGEGADDLGAQHRRRLSRPQIAFKKGTAEAGAAWRQRRYPCRRSGGTGWRLRLGQDDARPHHRRAGQAE